ncbi:MAG: 4Fe-4S dicluster domain-containing protein [Candidatus Eisenbacteria bacterium]|nr:4Fe-4S dicluster domain-containing protein [Candidatus Eisenbacteria bacterium]
MVGSLSRNLLVALGVAILGGSGAFVISSFREGERRAATVGLGGCVVGGMLIVAGWWLPVELRGLLLGLVGLGAVAAVVLFLWPARPVEGAADLPRSRVDERDIMFARARLDPGTPAYEVYYASHPAERRADDRIRQLPGLLSPDAAHANLFAFAAADGSFALTEALHTEVDGPVDPASVGLSAADASVFVKGLCKFYGAREVGITELRSYHLYSHVGRGSGEYGARVTLDHPYAVAFTVEMDYDTMRRAPRAPVVMESAHQYVEAARVAVQLGYVLRSLGYRARAHIDGDYRVVAPLVARDAGLGQIGRMGLLMTATLGPRVRLAVVTTDLPLVPDVPDYDASMIDFCRRCRKCAHACPANAIPTGNRREIDGALRWRIDSEACFRFWNAVGTDCGICMSVCPYSHPDTWAHGFVRGAIRRSGAARQVALWIDDVLYGRKLPPRPAVDWLPRDV